MKKLVLVFVLVLAATSAFAQSSWAKSYNKNGQFNIDVSVGYWYGITGSVGLEFIITEFKIGNVPFDFGVAVRGAVEYIPYYYDSAIFWGAGPLATLHMGLNAIPIEFFISAGLGLYGYGWTSGYTYAGYSAFGVGFASIDGIIWHFSPNFGLLLEGGYVGAAGVWGIGVELKL
jgi:hypothetical protein